MIFDPNFFPFSEVARAERFFCGNRATVLYFSLFWLLLLQMFTFLQNKSWSVKARPMQWFNRSKTIHKIAFLKKLPISDTVTYIMWCLSKMKCVYLTMSDNDFDTPLDFPQSNCDNYPEAEENSAWKLLDRWQLVPSRLQALGIVVGFLYLWHNIYGIYPQGHMTLRSRPTVPSGPPLFDDVLIVRAQKTRQRKSNKNKNKKKRKTGVSKKDNHKNQDKTERYGKMITKKEK